MNSCLRFHNNRDRFGYYNQIRIQNLIFNLKFILSPQSVVFSHMDGSYSVCHRKKSLVDHAIRPLAVFPESCNTITIIIFFPLSDSQSCSSSPCQNGGTCVSTGPSIYRCECPEGYMGLNCSDDMDMCTHTSPCQNGATCSNDGANSYDCQCMAQYTGIKCDVPIGENIRFCTCQMFMGNDTP